MNKEALMVMQRIYAGSREPVLILDEKWRVVWATDGTKPDHLPMLLGVPQSCWENVTRPLVIGETLYTCRLSCSEPDGLRIAVLSPAAQPLDLGQLGGQLQSMLTVCTALDAALDDLGIYEEREYLNVLARHILRVYRTAFLRREIERGISGMWKDEVFCLQTVLTDTFGKLPALLRDTAEVAVTLGEGKQFIRGDLHGFSCAVLAAMLLCIRKPADIQQIFVKVDAKEDKVLLELGAVPLGEKRRDANEQSHSDSCVSADDRELLEMYCRRFGISLFFAAEREEQICRLEIPICTEYTTIALRAPNEAGAGGFFDLVPVMMAGFRVRKRF